MRDNGIIIYYAGMIQSEIKYEDAFLLDTDLLIKVECDKNVTKEIGTRNNRLLTGSELEFLCRLLEKLEHCSAIRIEDSENNNDQTAKNMQENVSSSDGVAELYAFLIRRHMETLRSRGSMEAVFQGVCSLMQKKGCFEEFRQSLNSFLTDSRRYEYIVAETAPFLILRGDFTCGGLLQKFADELAEALVANGQAVIEYDGMVSDASIQNKDGLEGLEKTIWKAIVGFQALVMESPIFQKLRGPKIQFLFDNPFSFQNMMRKKPEEYLYLCQDGDYADWIRRYYHSNAIHFPTGGMKGKEEADISDSDRTKDLIFIGSLFLDNPESLTESQRSFYDFVLQNPTINFEQALLRMGEEHLLKENDALSRLPEILYSYLPARRAVIGHFRRMIIQTILCAGIKIHVYGDDWQNYQGKGRENLIIHPRISVEDSLNEFQMAKLALNIMSWHKDGMTERVSNIMLSGAVCITEETKYIRNHFRDGEELVLYRLDELQQLPDRILDLLHDEQKRKRIAQKALGRAMEELTWEKKAAELTEVVENYWKNKDNLRIFVCTHVKFNPPANPIYVPLHVGKKGKTDFGYIGDDTGENISDLNFLYGELTGLFWIWQNIHDIEYVGLCHYRRYFISDQKEEMQKEEYLQLLQHYDAIVPKHMECDAPSYYEHFGNAHNIRDLDAVGRALKQLYPEYGPAYDQAMSGKIFYWGNLVVTSLPILKAYAEWLFTIFLEAGEEIDVSGYDDYHKRVYGFLSEQMFYVFALANGLTFCEVSVGVSAEKAETDELKQVLQKLMAEGKNEEARQILEDSLRKRPDLLMENSDTKGELKAIYLELTKGN